MTSPRGVQRPAPDVPHERHVLSLRPEAAAREARRTVTAFCRTAAVGPGCTDAAALLTSELVTNALLHGDGEITLALSAGPELVRVEVGDRHPALPRVRRAEDDEEGGRGMLIVEALSSAWGCAAEGSGKVVWFEVPVQP